jgi:hypothetical protein
MMIGTFDSMDAEIDRGEGGKRSEEGTDGSSCDSGDVNFFGHCRFDNIKGMSTEYGLLI